MMSVWEVEFKHPDKGVRFLRHVKAETADDAVVLAVERQKSDMPVIGVKLYRKCFPGEREVSIRPSSDTPTIVLE